MNQTIWPSKVLWLNWPQDKLLMWAKNGKEDGNRGGKKIEEGNSPSKWREVELDSLPLFFIFIYDKMLLL